MVKNTLKNIVVLTVVGTLIINSTFAGIANDSAKNLNTPILNEQIHDGKNWTIELNSGFNDGNFRTDNRSYSNIPLDVTFSRKLDDVTSPLGDWSRGYTEVFLRGFTNFIVDGPESRFAGISFGPRYNFVRPNWKFIPFVEANVGVGFADSTVGDERGYGQDFNFTFGTSVGTKYLLTKTVFLRASADFQHVSNGGLSEPSRLNNPTDTVGGRIGIGFAF